MSGGSTCEAAASVGETGKPSRAKRIAGREHDVERQAPEPRVERDQAVDAAGDGDAADVVADRHPLHPLGPELGRIGP